MPTTTKKSKPEDSKVQEPPMTEFGLDELNTYKKLLFEWLDPEDPQLVGIKELHVWIYSNGATKIINFSDTK